MTTKRTFKYSITIPAYKAEFLRDAVKSIVEQDYKNWELIIVDDCSPEDLFSVVKEFLNDPRIHYSRNAKNCGARNVVDNWNKCLSLCTGDYVLCMGDDDMLLPNCLTEYNSLINKYPELNVYHGRANTIDEKNNIITTLEERKEKETLYDMLTGQWVNNRQQFLGDFLFSRAWLDSNNGYINFPFAYSSDWATANLAALHKGIANVNTPIFEYRINSKSISSTQNLRETVTSCNKAFLWYKELLKHIDGGSGRLLLNDVMDKYFSTKMKDLIYLDSKRGTFAEAMRYWSHFSPSIPVGKLQIIATCVRARLSKILKG